MERIFRIKIILALALFALGITAQAKVIVAEAGNPQKSIAIAFENAADGDTIFIKKGHYKEGALFLKNAVTIIGEGMPEIDGEHQHENLLIEHDDVKITGVQFSNSGSSNFNDIAALKIKDSKNIVISDCEFINNFFGIHTINSSYITYRNNKLSSGKVKGKPSANGIHCWKSNHLTIENNVIQGHRDGIYLEFVTNSHIENNQSISNGRYGMHFMFSHDNFFKKNIFKANGAGVAVMYSKRVTMTENIFTQSWGSAAYGILLKEIDDSKIYKNEFRNNTMGIYADGANRIEIRENLLSGNGWAIKINASSSDPVIENNNFIANSFDLATNGNLRAKSLDGNYWDKYEGYDLDRNGIGDIPFRPLSLFSMITEKNPPAMLLYRSFMVTLLDKSERVIPSLTPEFIIDNTPRMHPNPI